MSDLYCRDAYGRSVLIGLTYEETLEFEALDASSPTAEQALGLKWETDESSFPPDENSMARIVQEAPSCLRWHQ